MWIAVKTFGEGLGGFLLGSTFGRIVGALILGVLALMIYTHFIRADATEDATVKAVTTVSAKVEKAADTETDRRLKALEEAQKKTHADVQESLKLQRAQLRKLKDIDDASHANDHTGCLPADSVQRLNGLRPAY